METALPPRPQIVAGIVAGLVGAVTIEICMIGAHLIEGGPAATIAGDSAFMASTLVGRTGHAGAALLAIAVVMHVAISIGWALGYVYLSRTKPQLLAQPVVWGFIFGAVVGVFTEVVLITAGEPPGSPRALSVQLLADTVFYGVPVAVVASAMLRRSSAALDSERPR